MRSITCCLACASFFLSTPLRADEPLTIAATYERIVADYHRIDRASSGAAARAAANRMVRDAYQSLLERGKTVAKPSPDDLHALGACHEGLDDTVKAKESYNTSLKAAPQARTHLALARVELASNLTAAEQHFARAVALQADHPDVPQFRLALAVAHERARNWAGAVPHWEALLSSTNKAVKQAPTSAELQLDHSAIQKRLDRARRFVAIRGQPAPPLKVRYWAQGSAVELSGLKGKVVLVDFCAMWAVASAKRIEQLKEVHKEFTDDGVEIVSVTPAYQHKYDAATDEVVYEQGLKPEDEKAALVAFAKKHGIAWRLGIISPETIAQYGVSTLPHTMVLDKQGNVSTIFLGGDQAELDLPMVLMELTK